MNKVHTQIVVSLSVLFAIGAFFVLDYGLPFHLVGDEESIIGGTLELLQQRVLFPVLAPEHFSFLYYPVLQLYGIIALLLPFALGVLIFVPEVSTLTDLQYYLLVHLDYVWIVARLVSVLAGSALIFMTYRLAGVLFKQSKYIPLFAALLLTTSFFHFQLSVVMRHWIFTTLCFVSALYFLFKDNFTHPRSALAAGFCTGLSFGMGPIGFVTGFFITVSFILIKGKKALKEIFKKPFLIFASVSALFAVFFIATHPGAFDFIFAGEETSSFHEKTLGYYAYEYSLSLGYLFGKEFVIAAFSILGIGMLLLKKKYQLAVWTISVVLLHGFFLFTLFHNSARYHFYYVPILAIIAAYAISCIYQWFMSHKMTLTGITVVGIILISPIFMLLKYVSLLMTDTTEQTVATWIENHAAESPIILNSSALDFLQQDEYMDTQANYGRVRSQSSALKGVDVGKYGGKKYAFTNIHFWNEQNKNLNVVREVVNKYQPAYYVVTYDTPAELGSEINQYFINQGELVFSSANADGVSNQSFIAFSNFGFANNLLFSLDRFGRYAAIYKL